MESLIRRCNLLTLLLCWTMIALFPANSIADDSLRAEQSFNGTQTLVSAAQKFVLGFFSAQNSKFQYLGIWYKNIPNTIVWVANRDNPVENSSGRLTFRQGNLVLLNQTDGLLWSSNSEKTVKNPVVKLLDTGNLVLLESASQDFLWQSFDYPSHTLLPGMKLGWDLKTGLNRKLTSWKSSDDPTPGQFTYSVDPDGLPRFVIRKGDNVTYRSGPWYGGRVSGGPPFIETEAYKPKFVKTSDEVYYSIEAMLNIFARIIIKEDGYVQVESWGEKLRNWNLWYRYEGDLCDHYGFCGDFGICSISPTAVCECMVGFEPKSPEKWGTETWLDGCVRKDPKICRNGEGFRMLSGVKLPDSSGNFVSVNMTAQDCKAECLKNCFCLAYGILDDPEKGKGCVTWFKELIDIKYVTKYGEDLYVRVAASELESGKRKPNVPLVVVVVVAVVSLIILLATAGWFFIKKHRALEDNEAAANRVQNQENELEMPLFEINTIEAATDNFSLSNKVGEGGFGPVYKGRLPSGQEIAVKKLAESSRQGLQEFRNEILFISQLQHRNLVKLLGFCIHREETLLVYEYMPNKSLDYFLFDDQRRSLLDWKTRRNIIIGTARGLLYLHRDSRLRIIHRDLKVANILLDNEMNPKISDFGLARMFGEDQIDIKTKRVVGTYGYMSPEYAIDGYFSLKSDVFSFGVIVLEIISGKKNRGFFHPEHQLNLLGHVWKLWNEGKPLEFIDETLHSQFQEFEILRYIQVGLLCVQQDSKERPIMSSVLAMLENDNMQLCNPRQPGFYTERVVSDTDSTLSEKMNSTTNKVTVSLLKGR